MVNKETIKLKFDNSFNGRLFAVQGDTGRVFNLQIFSDLDTPIDITGMSIRFYIGNSKQVFYSDGTITDATQGRVEVPITNSMLAYPGLCKSQFVLTEKDGKKVGSKVFDLYVEESIENGATVGKNVIVDYSKIDEAVKLLKDYDKTLQDAKETDTVLKADIDAATETDNSLKESIGIAKTLNFESDIKKAKETRDDLVTNTTAGKQTKTDLDGSIATAKDTKSNLDGSITTANSTKTALDNSAKTAETANTVLTESINGSNSAKTDLEKLLQDLNLTKGQVQEIIANGNLEQYITDPKLQEALKNYATKDDLNKIDVTSQLADYAKKTEIPTKLSQLTNDKNFKTETEIQALINNSTKLKKEVVASLPQTGKDDVIYLVKDEKGKDNNNYLEYLWLNDKYELIGSTQVDLSGYMTNEDFKSEWEKVRRVVDGCWSRVGRMENEIPEKFQPEMDPSEDDKSYVTPWYVDSQYLEKQDIQEFTQQELEEAFK